MTNEEQRFHSERARQCREWAAGVADPDVRRRHLELANLHDRRAAAESPPARLASVELLNA